MKLMKRAAGLLCLNLGGFAVGHFAFKLVGKHAVLAVLFVAGMLTACASLCSYYLGRGLLLRQLREAGALRPPAPLSLQEISDTDLLVEMMVRSYHVALCQGDRHHVEQIRKIAERVPPLQARLEALSAEGPKINSTTRGQA